MFDARNLGIALLLILLLGCAAPQAPTITLATLEPTRSETAALSARATNSPTVSPSATATRSTTLAPTASPTHAPQNTRVPTAIPPTPEFVSAIEPLQVMQVEPAPNAKEVDTGQATHILVRFNFPVVPLTQVDAPNPTLTPLTLEPEIDFQGRWLNSFTFSITPTQKLEVATQYTVRVPAVQDLTGRVSKPYAWTFRTFEPRVTDSDPRPRGISRLRGLMQPIHITFNTEMDRASVETRLRVIRKKDNWAALGAFEWDGSMVRFTPTYPYDYDTDYRVELAQGAQDSRHRASLEKLELSFWTVKPFAFVSHALPDGERGGLVLRFTQPSAENLLRVSIVPKLDRISITQVGQNVNERVFRTHLDGEWQPATTYTVTIHPDTRSEFGETLGKETVVHFTTAPLDPFVWLHVPEMGLYDAYGPQAIFATYANLDQLDYALYRVPRADLFTLLGNSQYDLPNILLSYKPDEKNRARTWALALPKRLDASAVVSTTLNDAFGNRADAGAYLLRVNAPALKHSQARLVFISPFNLAIKYTDKEALIWVTDLATGKPAPNQPLALYSYANELLARGRSDQDGIFRASFAALDKNKTDGVSRFIVVSETADGKLVAVTASDWNEGIQTWDFNLPTDNYWMQREYRANVYTDRAVYRAGQTVYFKGIVREMSEPAPRVPTLKNVRVDISNSHYETISRQELALNEFGAFNGQIVLNENAPTGEYHIATEYGALTFHVAQYRRPEFQVAVNADKDEYANGETIRVNVNAAYYFGGPVADAEVTWRLLAQDFLFAPHLDGWWEFSDNTNQEYWYDEDAAPAQHIREGQGRTDANGNFQIVIPADLKEFARSQFFTIEAEIVDLNHQAVAQRVRVPVHRAAFYIGLNTSYVGSVNTNAEINVIALQANANARALALPAQPISVSVYRGEWVHAHTQVDGKWQWTSSYTETLVSKTEIVTAENGRAATQFAPTRGGQYRIVANAQDARGNPITSATWMWVSDYGYLGWKIDNNSRINLVSDKKEYLPGQVAELLVPAPFADAEALFTLERGGILQVERVSIQGNTARYRVPILPEYAPNVFVSVMLVKGRGADSAIPQFKMGYVTLQVKPSAHVLDVHVAVTCGAAASPNASAPASGVPAEAQTCEPQETATFEIQARDASNQPVRAEFSLAVVDQAVQSLVDDNTTPLLTTFYAPRALAVRSASSLVLSIERENQVVETGGKGGGGGGGDGSEFFVRREFLDTAYWNPTIVTDENGHARVSMKLPDNLTTWNVTVKGITRETRSGQADADFISTKPLLLRPVTPRFFVVNDVTFLEAVINNNTDENVFANVGLNAQGLTIQDGIARSLEIPARGKASVTWKTKVNVTDKAKLLFTVSATPLCANGNAAAPSAFTVSTTAGCGAELRDAVELTLPVQYPEITETLTSAEPVGARLVKTLQWNESLPAPTPLDTLQIELTPSLAAASREGLKYLEAFEWECSEQTTSKFLPNIVTYRALERLKLERPELYAALQTNVSREIQRLYVLQNPDGGWGWWQNQSSRPVLTAYALYALHQARKAGLAVDTNVMQRAENFLNTFLNAKYPEQTYNIHNERAFTLFVLSEMGRDVQSRALNLFEQRAQLDLYAQAFLMLALAPQNPARAKILADELAAAARVNDAYVTWSETKNDDWSMNTNTRTHAIVVMAMARVAPDHPLLPRAVKWLMQARQWRGRFAHWETTQETAWAVMALTEWMVTTRELEGNYAYQVTFNNKVVGSGSVNAANVDQTRILRVAVQDTLQNLGNEIVVTRDATQGALYYSASLRRYADAETIPAVSRGIVVQRAYYAVDPLTLNSTNRAIDAAALGEYVQVKLTISTLSGVRYFAVEDMLPAGFEAVDTTLKTSSDAASDSGLRSAESTGYDPYWWYWGHSEVRDDRVALFAEWLSRGTYEYTYLMRASVAGTFHALPARAYAMYEPTKLGQSAGSLFTITK